jgi:pimeloyl-ACP methyl ester carboxylesterase
MSYISSNGVKLYYEEEGHGEPVIFCHEMTGDMRVWESQIRHFARYYRCIAFNARGYAPSDIPTDPAAYSQTQAADDVAAVMHGLNISKAHVVGLSMGAYTALHFGIRYPTLAHSIVVAGCGHGSARDAQKIWVQQANELADKIDQQGMEQVAKLYANSPYRVQFRDKDRRGWSEWSANLEKHSAEGLAMSVRRVQGTRPSVLDMEEDLRNMNVPTLLVAGDEDEPVLEMNLYLKRTIPRSGLLLLPKTGHAVNSEEPARFNAEVADFFHKVELSQWNSRSPEAFHTEVWLPQER